MWLHVPSTYLVSVPEEEGWTSESDSLYQALEQSATWKERSPKPASWRRALRRASWTMRLSGLTCSPSRANRGAAAWIASLEASPASRTPTPGSDAESSTNGTSGLTWPELYGKFVLQSYSLRTSQGFWATTTEKSDPYYKQWATQLRRDSSRRRKLARHIFGNGSSSWPTAQAYSHDPETSNQPGQVKLDQAAKNWPTPSTAPEAPNTNSNTVNGPTSLGEAVSLWQTPKTSAGGNTSRGHDRKGELLLAGQAQAWATPTSHDGRRPGTEAGSTQGRNLKREAEAWATPMANDGVKPSAGKRATADLSHQAQQATGGDGSNPSQLPNQLSQSPKSGSAEYGGRLLRRRLNPLFVCHLMGWPEAILCASSETALCLWWRRMRSVLSLLGWES